MDRGQSVFIQEKQRRDAKNKWNHSVMQRNDLWMCKHRMLALMPTWLRALIAGLNVRTKWHLRFDMDCSEEIANTVITAVKLGLFGMYTLHSNIHTLIIKKVFIETIQSHLKVWTTFSYSITYNKTLKI